MRYSLYLAAFVLGGLVALAVDPVEEWAIAFGTRAFALRAEPPAASHRYALQSPIAGER